VGSLQESPTLLILRCRARHILGATQPAPDGRASPSNAAVLTEPAVADGEPGSFLYVRRVGGNFFFFFSFCLPPVPLRFCVANWGEGEYTEGEK
jgi:hypothetical protein